MKFLCLAYGSETDWSELSKAEQDMLLAQDELLRQRGALMGAVKTEVTTVRAWSGVPEAANQPFAKLEAPLAGFSIIEADTLADAVKLVANTPCARAKGAIEIRPILILNAEEWKATNQQDR